MATTLEDVDRVLADYRPGPDDPDLAELMRGHLKAAAAEAAEAGHVEPAQPFEVESADESEPPRREWLIPGWLPRGRLASIYGRGEAGKSRLLLHVAHAVACGGPVLPWDPDVKADAVRGDVPQVADVGRVLLVTWEDEAAEVRRRWRMAHAAGAVGTERMPAEIAILDMRPARGGAAVGAAQQGVRSRLDARRVDRGRAAHPGDAAGLRPGRVGPAGVRLCLLGDRPGASSRVRGAP